MTFVRYLRWYPSRPGISRVVPSSVPRAVPSAHPPARTELEPRGSLQPQERGRAVLPRRRNRTGLPAGAGQQSWGWEGEKRSRNSRKTPLLRKMSDTCLSHAQQYAHREQLWAVAKPKLFLVEKLLLSVSYWVCHRGTARGRSLFFLLCSCTPLKQKVWAYKYCVIES